MLAGLIGALIGVVGTNPESVRWTGPTLAMLALAVLCLLASMQAWIRGASYRVSFSEIEERIRGLPKESAAQVEQRRKQSFEGLTDQYLGWVLRSRWCFQLGVALFLAGLALVLMPTDGASDPGWRWIAAAAIAAFALMGALAIPYREHRDLKFAKSVARDSWEHAPGGS